MTQPQIQELVAMIPNIETKRVGAVTMTAANLPAQSERPGFHSISRAIAAKKPVSAPVTSDVEPEVVVKPMLAAVSVKAARPAVKPAARPAAKPPAVVARVRPADLTKPTVAPAVLIEPASATLDLEE